MEVGRINVVEIAGVSEPETGQPKIRTNGNHKSHGLAVNRLTDIPEYKTTVRGIELVEVDKRETNKL